MLNKNILVYLCVPILCFAPFAHAAPIDDLDALMALDIETLSNIQVSTASKRLETISEAPGIVTVITKEDIQRYGYRDLADIFRRLPNTEFTGGAFLTQEGTGINIRGQVQDAVTNQVLILINGRPFRDSQLNGWNHALFYGMPVEMIERIESIRGPGSVLYGTSAFSGVINIITKKPETQDKTETYLSAGYGSYNTQFGEGTYRMYNEANDFSLSIGGRRFDTDGFKFNTIDFLGNNDNGKFSRDDYGIFSEMRYKNLTVNGFIGKMQVASLGVINLFPLGQHRQTREFLDIGYIQPLWNDWKARINLTYNGFGNYAADSTTIHDHNEFNDILYEGTLEGSLFNTINLVLGATYDDRDGSLKLGQTRFTESLEGYYIQADTQIFDWMKIVGGLQANRPEALESYDLSPRIGTIINITEEFGAKALYGEAFRAPTGAESSLNIPTVVGNPNLENTKIKTTDFQVFYNAPRYSAAATYYISDILDPIGVVPNPNAPPALIFSNTSKNEYHGIEFEGKALLTDEFEIQGSFNYQWGKNPTSNNKDITASPHLSLKLGGSYRSEEKGVSIGVYNIYSGDTTDYFSTSPGNRQNRSVESTNYLSSNLELDINTLANFSSNTPDMSFTLYGENLLDEYLASPDTTSLTNSQPIRGGRAFYGRFNIKF